jgi:hypothetical protein
MKSDMIPGLKSYGVRNEREKIPEVMMTTGVHSQGDSPCDPGNRETDPISYESGRPWYPDLFEFY